MKILFFFLLARLVAKASPLCFFNPSLYASFPVPNLPLPTYIFVAERCAVRLAYEDTLSDEPDLLPCVAPMGHHPDLYPIFGFGILRKSGQTIVALKSGCTTELIFSFEVTKVPRGTHVLFRSPDHNFSYVISRGYYTRRHFEIEARNGSVVFVDVKRIKHALGIEEDDFLEKRGDIHQLTIVAGPKLCISTIQSNRPTMCFAHQALDGYYSRAPYRIYDAESYLANVYSLATFSECEISRRLFDLIPHRRIHAHHNRTMMAFDACSDMFDRWKLAHT